MYQIFGPCHLSVLKQNSTAKWGMHILCIPHILPLPGMWWLVVWYCFTSFSGELLSSNMSHCIQQTVVCIVTTSRISNVTNLNREIWHWIYFTIFCIGNNFHRHTKSYFEFLTEPYIKHDASTESQYIPEANHCFQIWCHSQQCFSNWKIISSKNYQKIPIFKVYFE